MLPRDVPKAKYFRCVCSPCLGEKIGSETVISRGFVILSVIIRYVEDRFGYFYGSPTKREIQYLKARWVRTGVRSFFSARFVFSPEREKLLLLVITELKGIFGNISGRETISGRTRSGRTKSGRTRSIRTRDNSLKFFCGRAYFFCITLTTDAETVLCSHVNRPYRFGQTSNNYGYIATLLFDLSFPPTVLL